MGIFIASSVEGIAQKATKTIAQPTADKKGKAAIEKVI